MLGGGKTSRPRWVAFVLLAAGGSQAGHLISYLLRFGPGGWARQGQGMHAYLPGLVAGLGSLLGASLLASLVVVGLARLLHGRCLGRSAGAPPPLLDTLAVLFTVQLALYAAQETAEAAAAGVAHLGPFDLLLWGTLGQLPAALAAAVALRWLTVHLGAALAALAKEPEPVQPWAAAPREVCLHTDCEAVALLKASLAVFAKRGPPESLPVGS